MNIFSKSFEDMEDGKIETQKFNSKPACYGPLRILAKTRLWWCSTESC